MTNPASDQDFDGCHRACRAKGKHSLIWGGCEHATPPEPTVSMSVVYDDTDGHKSIGFDMYTVPQLAELIEPALRTIRIRLGPNALALLERGQEVQLSAGEYASLALAAADAIMHRNDKRQPKTEAQLGCVLCGHLTCMGGKPCGVVSTERGELAEPCGCVGVKEESRG
ncbi:hypothetical protein [Streptomyces cylindrosporus]|uniref:Uncharacterized protein n=1 Tax=Streptomyces cylindrosporus TaxID=2927583 RepID=A0ABS9YPN8_9ACTN|nr:hypothetical protein [Streptomyces cylindrosporus]MCI3279182.1 hypothetical protein [Streptomyces cylindrosporus]